MIEDEKLLNVAREIGTPLYVYDGEIILNRLKRLCAAFPGFEISYYFKANPNPAIGQILANTNTSVCVASIQELDFALKAKYIPSKITFGGPGKTRKDLEKAIDANVEIIDIESELELKTVEELGADLNKKIKVILRINTLHGPESAGEIMSGIPSKFGFDEEKLIEKLKGLKFKYVEIIGIHAHSASQVFDCPSIIDHYKNVAIFSKNVANELDFKLKIINFGGGFGIPYSTDQPPLNLDVLGQSIKDTLDSIFPNHKPIFCIEPGRYLLAESGTFLTTIVDEKNSRGVNFLITDSGISGFSRPAMPWAQQHNCSILSKSKISSNDKYKVVGRSCLEADVLCIEVKLPNPDVGDIIAVHNSGAYGYTMSMLYWSSLTLPAEVLFFKKKCMIIRDRQGVIR
ncbi:MAG: alanine racemase [Candidatus Peribacteraceae bacterium]|nr:alanine racemase [Candidatus Peribacteraceae bacterium]